MACSDDNSTLYNHLCMCVLFELLLLFNYQTMLPVLVSLMLAANVTLCIFSLTQMLTSVIVLTMGAVTIFVPTLPEVITARAMRDLQ